MAIMTLKEIVLDTDLPPSQKQRLNDALDRLEELEALFVAYSSDKKYLVFSDASDITKKTKIIDIHNNHDELLGFIKWYGPWRAYCAHIGGIFDVKCLFDVIVKVAELNTEHKKVSGSL